MKRVFVVLMLLGIVPVFYSFQKKQKFDLKASVARGKDIYLTNCLSCHMEGGEGLSGIYPPLAKSDYLMADKTRSIKETLFGVKGEMIVNGETYNAEMNAIDLSDQDVSDVLNYVRNSWGNKGAPVRPEEVKALRK